MTDREPSWQGKDWARIQRARTARSRRPANKPLVLVSVVLGFVSAIALLASVNIGDVACSGGDATNGCADPPGEPLLVVGALLALGVGFWQAVRGFSAASAGYLVAALLALIVWAATI